MALYIRVSEILSRLQNFSVIDPIMLENKAKIGTDVHKAIIEDAVGDFPVLETQRASAYFASYLLWKNKAKPEYCVQVPRLYDNELMITGEIDALVRVPNGRPYIADWKCSANANEEIWNMQAHFYWYLLKQNNIEVSDKMVWVNLRHRKWYEDNHERYSPMAPKVYEFHFDENILSRCFDEANKAWEEKKNSIVVDF